MLRNCQLSISAVVLQSNRTAIPAGTYSVTGCLIKYTGAQDTFNNTAWNINGTYTYSSPESTEMLRNISDAESNFFNSTGTILSILIVVIIILAISLIIAIVSRFGSGGGIGGGKGGKEYGSDTVMGI